ncbi:HAMP domain-containing histidine kinase [Dehalobacter sp. DCM]|uniref:HAMP domain-containing sensor histidine kinase n=1 Tax=Dehalobacter sp. DCM TaxID=2907827 RepID=UPI003081A6C6|nr:HAMP domain-containing histidine kinase [Dehalobacter sp. DCM]
MRWSIRFKLPFMVFLVFLLVSLSVLFYYRFFMLEAGERSIQMNREALDRNSVEIAQGISVRYPDSDQIRTYLQDMAQKEKMNILVYDTNKQLAYQAESHHSKMFEMKSSAFVSVNGQTVFLLETETSFMPKDIMGMSILEGFVFFTLIILSLILLILVIYLHYNIVKPLSLLQNSFGLVGYRKNRQLTSLPLNRKDEIGDLAAGFEEMVKKLHDSHDQQLEMISSISHDLKTPLTSIRGYMERLLFSNIKTEEKKREYYRIIYQKAEDIQQLLQDFSDYTQNEEECTKLNQEAVALKSFFISICDEYAEELQAYHTDFTYQTDIAEHFLVLIDVRKIRRVVANLISNSLKYADPPIKIIISCTVWNGLAVITIEDNGRGVPEEDLANIFNKFYRTDKSRSTETMGAGLGLAICKRIVESHNGSINAYNRTEGGFGIRFTLPLIK